jgi:hypothetical protein
MNEVDEFSRTLIEEAKRFLEKAQEEENPDGKTAFLHAAFLLGFSALEAHINAIADDFLVRTDLSILERSVLAEQDFRFEDGEFRAVNQLKMYRLLERLEFLHRRFSGKPIDKASSWWGELKSGINLRNKLVHPKDAPKLTEAATGKALKAILQALDTTYRKIYGTRYPGTGRGLDSSMEF